MRASCVTNVVEVSLVGTIFLCLETISVGYGEKKRVTELESKDSISLIYDEDMWTSDPQVSEDISKLVDSVIGSRIGEPLLKLMADGVNAILEHYRSAGSIYLSGEWKPNVDMVRLVGVTPEVWNRLTNA